MPPERKKKYVIEIKKAEMGEIQYVVEKIHQSGGKSI